MDEYLVRFVTEISTCKFRFAEFDSLLEHFGLSPRDTYDGEEARSNDDWPYVRARFPSAEIAKDICSRGILLRDAIELWGFGSTHAECVQAVKNYDKKEKYLAADVSWRTDVETFGASASLREQNNIRAMYAPALPFEGRVNLLNPTETFQIYVGKGMVFFGRKVGKSERRELVTRCELKKRVFLGPTSLDNELALIMATISRCSPGKWALDPYAGTGSILVACQLGGARCFGTDIDWRVLRGKDQDENDGAMRRRIDGGHVKLAKDVIDYSGKRKTIFSNFEQYGLQTPEIVRLDASRLLDHFRSDAFCEFFDSVVTDPPYGIRAGARTVCSIGDGDQGVKPVRNDHRANHIPRTKPYPVVDVLADLLEIAATVLKIGGVLAYLLPATLDFAPETDVPRHPALSLLDCCEQPISSKYSRYLIVMRKNTSWKHQQIEEVKKARAMVRSSADAPYASLKEKLFAGPSSEKTSE